MNENVPTITVSELYSDHLDEIESAANKASTVMQVISGHFEYTEEALQKNEILAYYYRNGYSEIQTLLSILYDYIWDIKKKMETVMAVEIVPDEATA